MKAQKKYIPNADRAIVTGRIATIWHGNRVVRFYKSGEPLLGKPETHYHTKKVNQQ